MILSVIIVNYNGEDLLIDSIDSIIENSFFRKNSTEIIVVDNNSNDNSMVNLKKYIKNNKLQNTIKTKVLDSNYGFAKANNIGVRIAKGDYLLFINNDTYLYNFDIKDLLSKYKNIAPGIIAPRLLNVDLSIQKSYFRFPSLYKLFLETSGLKYIIKYFLKKFNLNINRFTDHNPQKVQYVSGACFLIEKHIYKKLRGFDEDYYFYHEECDLMYRARKENIYSYIDKENNIVHYGGGKKPFNEMKYSNYYKSLLLFFKKHKKQVLLPKMLILIGLYFRNLLVDIGFNIFIDPINIYNKNNVNFSNKKIKKIYKNVINKIKKA